MNRLTVVGRIVRDVELREVGEGKLVTNNTLAIARNYKTDQGQEADFLNFVAWGKRAELIEEYCDKGDLIGFDGRVQSRTYQNEEDNTIYVVEMIVESVHFLQPKKMKRKEEIKDKKEINKKVRPIVKLEDKVLITEIDPAVQDEVQSLQDRIKELVE